MKFRKELSSDEDETIWDLHADLQAVRAAVVALLDDKSRISSMSPLEHWQWATHLPACCDVPEVPALLRTAMDRSLALPADALQKCRQNAKLQWTERKRVLDPIWEIQWRRLPPHIRTVLGPKKNLLLFAEMLAAAQCPDENLVACLKGGFPMSGYLPRSGTLRPVPNTTPALSVSQLRAGAPKHNEEMARRVQTSQLRDPGVISSFWDEIKSEVQSGKAAWLHTREALRSAVVTPRFAVDQGVRWKNGRRRRKVRLIDDFLASLINDTVSPGEMLSHDGLDVLVSLIRQVTEKGYDVKFRKEDFTGAYKTLPLRGDELDLAVAVLKAADDDVAALQLFCCSFGAVGSVHAWHRLGAAVQQTLAKLFAIPYARYVDDLFGKSCRLDLSPQAASANWQANSPGGPLLYSAVVRECISHHSSTRPQGTARH